MFFNTYRFANPEFFWLLILIPLLVVWYILKYNRKFPYQKIPTLKPFETIKHPARDHFRHLLLVFRLLGISFIIIALARPQSTFDREKVTTEGIDIVVALDISSSMLALDFSPDRLGAAKNMAEEFIDNRKNDRIGLVVFSSESFTQCPITTDHTVLKSLIHDVKSGMIDDGTAIGLGLATAVDRLRNSPGKSRIIILLTDGVNNSGFVNPVTAAEIAKLYNVRVYTIGIGQTGLVPYPFKTPYGTDIQKVEVQYDEPLLRQIAGMTGGNYYPAYDNNSLKMVYDKIDKLEKARIEVTTFRKYSDRYLPFALLAALFLCLEIVLKYTVFRFLP